MQLNGLKKLSYLGILYCSFDIIYPVPSLSMIWRLSLKHCQRHNGPRVLSHCSTDLHNLVQTCAESRVEHLCRSTGRPELEGQLSVIIGQYRRLLSSCIVRAQAQCLISRVGVIAPQAREAAQRREVAGRMERVMREERKAQWMASLRGPGWARRGRCHGF